jgi:phosphotransferase system HPr (HPr) family protein
MTSRKVVIGHRLGLHARASAQLVQLSSRFSSDIRIARPDRGADAEADARSILAVLLLAAGYGTMVQVSAEGDDEQEAVSTICDYLEGTVNSGSDLTTDQ